MPKLRGDYGESRSIPEDWVKKAINLRREIPSRTARVLVEILMRLEGCPPINKHTLDAILRRRGWTRAQAGKKPKKRKVRWLARFVNDLWQGDATPGLWLPTPSPVGKRQTVLFLWLDDVSRLIPYAEFFWDGKLPRMERTLKLGLCRRGLPTRVYTDNGNVYQALQFKAALAELSLAELHTKAYTPEGRGKIERMFGVLQQDFYPEAAAEIEAGRISSLSQLNEALWAWLECVYHHRAHSELPDNQTPLEIYGASSKAICAADPVRVARAFLWRYTRKVSGNGFISLLGNTYTVDPSWSGQKIELRLDPYDLGRVDVYRDKRPIGKAVVKNLKVGRILEIERFLPTPLAEPSGINFLQLLVREHREKLARETGHIEFAKAFEI
jgi:transposase InsO family protein